MKSYSYLLYPASSLCELLNCWVDLRFTSENQVELWATGPLSSVGLGCSKSGLVRKVLVSLYLVPDVP